VTQLLTCRNFMQKIQALWPAAEVTLRGARVARVIKEHDEYLKERRWYDLITATLDENWMDDAVDGYLYTGNTD
jgi:hypothetical protein